VEFIFEFYAKADWISGEGPKDIGLHEMCRQIQRLSAAWPAVVILTDLEPVEEDDVIRTIHNSAVSDVLMSLMTGHPQTRIAITTSERSKWALAKSLGFEVLEIPLDGLTELEEVTLPTEDLHQILSPGFKTTGVCWLLAKTMLSLADVRAPAKREAYCREAEARLIEHDAQSLASVIFSGLLTETERTLLGLVATSRDGLRRSVLDRLHAAFVGCGPNSLNSQLNRTECLQLTELRTLLRIRVERVDPQLSMAGEPPEEETFLLDEPWRRLFLIAWWSKDPRQARRGSWLISCEAARQARLLRIHQRVGDGMASRGRDIQALVTLIASVDPGAVKKDNGSTVNGPFPERAILPSLEGAFLQRATPAEQPDPRTALQFALLHLYRRDMEGASFRLLSAMEDARSRLGVLMAFFAPSVPWARLDELKLVPDWSAYGYLRFAFSEGELMAMLTTTAMAALRLQRHDIVTAAVRLGEALAEQTEASRIPKVEFMRLLRTEVDAALLLGRNPDAGKTVNDGQEADGFQINSIIGRISNLRDTWFPCSVDGNGYKSERSVLFASAKMACRLGEAYHMAGDRKKAAAEFEEALRIENAMRADKAIGASVAPIFGGRGSRAVIRFRLDLARHMAWTSKWTMMIFEKDGLALPDPLRLEENGADGAISLARALLDENARRLTRGRQIEEIGLKIDAARIAAALHEFGPALEHLDRARAPRDGTDPTIEILMELAAVRARISLEAAMVCIRVDGYRIHFASSAGEESPGPYYGSRHWHNLQKAVRAIGAYLGRGEERPPAELAATLVGNAHTSLDTLDRLCPLVDDRVHPHTIDARYLRGLSFAVLSRVDVTENWLPHLREAKRHIDLSLTWMRLVGYRENEFVAAKVAKSIDDAIRRIGDDAHGVRSIPHLEEGTVRRHLQRPESEARTVH